VALHILLTCYTGRAVVSAGLWVALVGAAFANEKEGRRSRPCSTRDACEVIHRPNARAYREESPVGQGLWWFRTKGYRQTAGVATRRLFCALYPRQIRAGSELSASIPKSPALSSGLAIARHMNVLFGRGQWHRNCFAPPACSSSKINHLTTISN
jgi:hypothetical protein